LSRNTHTRLIESIVTDILGV